MVRTILYVMGKRKENSTNSLNQKYIIECDLAYSIHLLEGRWKLIILCSLEKGTMRYSELRDKIGEITERMLTLKLRELEQDGLIIRTVYPEVPPRVDYELSDVSKDLIPIWRSLETWGAKHKELKNSSY